MPAPNSSASPIVHLNTPPNATSSPKTTAESSFVNAMLSARVRAAETSPDEEVAPHCIPDRLIHIHLASLAASDQIARRRTTACIVAVGPPQLGGAQGRVAGRAQESRGSY